MEQSIFERLRDIIYQESGITLSDEKRLLLQNRIRKRLRSLRINSEEDYLQIVESDLEGSELINLIDAISTNHTFFFRERSHFDFLAELLKEHKEPQYKLWCAAASTGEEPYTLAITALENLKNKKAKILATDICTPVLKKAARGVYHAKSLQEMSSELRTKYFDPLNIAGEACYRVKPELSQLILFKRLNLNRFPYPLKGPLDSIFCRNVMIYFDNTLRAKLIESFYKLLKPGGYLFVGHSESLSGVEHKFATVQSAVYRKEVS